MPTNISDFVIIGGGLSGVTFAHFAAMQGKKSVILEKRDTLGGCIRTVYPCDGYFLELGAHTIYRSYATMIEMIQNMQIRHNIVPHKKQSYRMWSDGKISSLFSHMKIFGILRGLFKMSMVRKHGLTVEEYYTKVFGKDNYENLIHPATSAVICQDSGSVAADLLLKRRPKNKKFPTSFTMLGGLGALLRAAASLDEIDVRLSTEAVSVKCENGVYIVNTKDGEYKAKQLVMAATAPESAALIAPVYPGLASALNELPMKSSRAVTFCTGVNNADMIKFGYIIARGTDFTSVVSRDVVPDSKYRGATFHFKPSADPSKDLESIACVYKMKDPGDIKMAGYTFVLPQLGVAHYQWHARIEAMLDKTENFCLLGNFFDGLSMEDCAGRAKKEALRATKQA